MPALETVPVEPAVEDPELQELALVSEEPETHEGALLVYDVEAFSGTLTSDLAFSEETFILEESAAQSGSSSDEMPEDLDEALFVKVPESQQVARLTQDLDNLAANLALSEDTLLTTQ